MKLEPVSTEKNWSGPVAVLKLGIDVGLGTSIPIEDSGHITIALLVIERADRLRRSTNAKTGEISCCAGATLVCMTALDIPSFHISVWKSVHTRKLSFDTGRSWTRASC